MIGCIQVPDAITLIVKHDGVCIQIIGKILLEDLVDLTVFILEDHISLAVYCLDVALIGIQLVSHRVAAVEDDHLRAADHLCQQRPHIGVIHGKGRTVDHGDLLFDLPIPWKLYLFIIPHTIELNDDSVRLVLFLQFGQSRGVEVLFLLDHFHHRAGLGQKSWIILQFSLLTDDQQCFSLGLEIRLAQSERNEPCLAALQKTVNHIYGLHTNTSFSIETILPACPHPALTR